MTAEPTAAEIADPTIDDITADHHGAYAAMRTRSAAVPEPDARCWFVTRAVDVESLLLDDRLGGRGAPSWLSGLPDGVREPSERVEAVLSRWLVFSSGPEHERLRRVVAPRLSQQRLAHLQTEVAAWTDEVVDAAAGAEEAELVSAVVRPLARRAVGGLFGVDPATTRHLAEAADLLTEYLSTPQPTPAGARAGAAAVDAFAAAAQRYESSPSSGRVRVIINAARQAGASDTDVVAIFSQLVHGAIEPLEVSIAMAMLMLKRHPSVVADLGAGRLERDRVVEEILRFEAPFHFSPRVASEELQIGDQTVPGGDQVLLVVASANRDEQRWPDPAAFQPDRADLRHLTFGRGKHLCPGAGFVRLQLRALVSACLRTGLHDRIDLESVELSLRFGASGVRLLPTAPGCPVTATATGP